MAELVRMAAGKGARVSPHVESSDNIHSVVGMGILRSQGFSSAVLFRTEEQMTINDGNKRITYKWTQYSNNPKITVRRVISEDYCDVAHQAAAEALIKKLEAIDLLGLPK
jgi:hypothetical protein